MNFEQARFNMVEQQIRPWNVNDPQVLTLLSQIKREHFVSPEYRALALADIEIPLPGGQAMLYPRMEARMLQELGVTKKDKVLEIGTGSGYLTALIAKQADFVYTTEINQDNYNFALANLSQAGIKNLSLVLADGCHGLEGKVPFDKILVGGSLASLPTELLNQLKVGGRLVAIIGSGPIMEAIAVDKLAADQFCQTKLFETWVNALVSHPQQPQFKL